MKKIIIATFTSLVLSIGFLSTVANAGESIRGPWRFLGQFEDAYNTKCYYMRDVYHNWPPVAPWIGQDYKTTYLALGSTCPSTIYDEW